MNLIDSKKSVPFNFYSSIHIWLVYHYGKADHCNNKACNHVSKKYDWAKLHDYLYDKDINIFTQLCRTCHRNYDYYDKEIEIIHENFEIISKNKNKL